MWIFPIRVSDMDIFYPVKYVFMIFYRTIDMGGWGSNAKQCLYLVVSLMTDGPLFSFYLYVVQV